MCGEGGRGDGDGPFAGNGVGSGAGARDDSGVKGVMLLAVSSTAAAEMEVDVVMALVVLVVEHPITPVKKVAGTSTVVVACGCDAEFCLLFFLFMCLFSFILKSLLISPTGIPSML